MKNTLYKIALAASVVVVGCKPTLTAPSVSKGSMDPTNYVAIGGTMTAGYADGGLTYKGQQNSYANLIAGQFKMAGGGNFNQPYISSSSIGCGAGGASPLQLGNSTDCLGATSLIPVPISATGGDVSIFSNLVYATEGPFNNMGVPGAKLIYTLVPGYGNAANGTGKYNPFFYRMAANPVASSILSDAVAVKASFFTIFTIDDVLNYAMAGGAYDSITSSSNFAAALNAVVTQLKANGAKGAIAGIPDVTEFPFFTTIPYNGLALDSSNASLMNLVYNARNIYFHVGNNPFLIQDPSAPYGIRLMKADEHLLLTIPLDSVKCDGLGSYYKGIPNQYVLTETEIANIRSATATLNGIIQQVCGTNGLAYVNTPAFFNSLQTGIIYNGISMNAQFVTGGTFSLDGINLNPRGQAMLANQFITAINAQYGSTYPGVDATQYSGAIFP